MTCYIIRVEKRTEIRLEGQRHFQKRLQVCLNILATGFVVPFVVDRLEKGQGSITVFFVKGEVHFELKGA